MGKTLRTIACSACLSLSGCGALATGVLVSPYTSPEEKIIAAMVRYAADQEHEKEVAREGRTHVNLDKQGQDTPRAQRIYDDIEARLEPLRIRRERAGGGLLPEERVIKARYFWLYFTDEDAQTIYEFKTLLPKNTLDEVIQHAKFKPFKEHLKRTYLGCQHVDKQNKLLYPLYRNNGWGSWMPIEGFVFWSGVVRGPPVRYSE
jgi:hypothetical protein